VTIHASHLGSIFPSSQPSPSARVFFSALTITLLVRVSFSPLHDNSRALLMVLSSPPSIIPLLGLTCRIGNFLSRVLIAVGYGFLPFISQCGSPDFSLNGPKDELSAVIPLGGLASFPLSFDRYGSRGVPPARCPSPLVWVVDFTLPACIRGP